MTKSRLASISHGCFLLDQAFEFIKPNLIPGKTEQQIKKQINNCLKKAGVEGFAFPTIVAFGNHTGNIHHQPTKRKLTKNQIVMIDMGVKINGYCSDETRMFFVGKPKPAWVETYRLVLKAQEAAIFHLRGGKLKASAIDTAARKFFPIPHSVGHGLGKIIHDNPKINPVSKHKIKPGDIFTVEPGRYFKNRFGVRIEDSIVKTKTGYLTLTKFPKSLKSVIIN